MREKLKNLCQNGLTVKSKRAEGLCVQSNLIMEKAESTYLDFNEESDYDFKASRSCLTQVL